MQYSSSAVANFSCQQPAAHRLLVTLAEFLCSPAHDMAISQCSERQFFTTEENFDISVHTLSKCKGKQSQKIF
jgi:hypothetical protein